MVEVNGREPLSMNEMVFDVVLAALRNHNPNSFSINELVTDFVTSMRNLDTIGVVATAEEPETEEWNAGNAIQEDFVVCLECGFQAKQLTNRHMKIHGMTMKEYKKKWGYKQAQKLVCLKTSRKRKKSGKKRGVPEALMQYHANRRKAKEEAEKAAKKTEKKVEKKTEKKEPEKKVETRRRRQPAPVEDANTAVENTGDGE